MYLLQTPLVKQPQFNFSNFTFVVTAQPFLDWPMLLFWQPAQVQPCHSKPPLVWPVTDHKPHSWLMPINHCSTVKEQKVSDKNVEIYILSWVCRIKQGEASSGSLSSLVSLSSRISWSSSYSSPSLSMPRPSVCTPPPPDWLMMELKAHTEKSVFYHHHRYQIYRQYKSLEIINYWSVMN